MDGAYSANMTKRNRPIDNFRGLSIILMAIVNYLGGVDAVPPWLKHSPDIGLTIADYIAPMFIFAIGLTYRASFERHLKRDGLLEAYRHFAVRYLAILGIGAVLTAGETDIAMQSANWGVLQAIGAAGLICLIFIRLNTYLRFAVGLFILACYQLGLDNIYLQTVLHSSHGGFPGALSWGGMLLLATVLADSYYSSRKKFAAFSFILLAAGAAAGVLIPLSKVRVSFSYVLLTTASSAVVFLVFDLFSRKDREPGLLSWWGENPILFYFIHLVLIGFFLLPGIPALYGSAPLWVNVLELVLVLSVISSLAGYLHRKKIIIRL